MASGKKELINLLKKYRSGKASPEEVSFLEKYYQHFDKQEKISQQFSENDRKELGEKMFSAIQSQIQKAPVISIYKRRWIRISAAACVALLIGFGWYTLINKPENFKPIEVVQTHDVKPPASNRATITLANGKVVYLDSVSNGPLAQQGSVSLQKLADGQIVYTGKSVTASITYNTLSNPRGSKVIDMTLNDGTRVWLNAGSSVTYPVAFVGNERKVSINGEAYFEVAHNAAMPFKVSKGEIEVTVLGTHFNVNAYEDESDIKVTLLEGSVKMSIVNSQWSILKPGEQGVTKVDGKLKVEKGIDVDAVMAWKNGYFNFKSADIEEIMRQMARWYDVDIAFEYKTNQVFVAEIPRNVNASDFFKILEATGWVHFKIEGRKVTVLK